jgi:hypothetical protein
LKHPREQQEKLAALPLELSLKPFSFLQCLKIDIQTMIFLLIELRPNNKKLLLVGGCQYL